MGAAKKGGIVLYLRTEGLDGKVITPHFAVGRAGQKLGLEGRLMVDTDGIHDTIRLVCDALETTDPFSSITESANALDRVWAVECGWYEVPDCVGRPRLLVGREPASNTSNQFSGAHAKSKTG